MLQKLLTFNRWPKPAHLSISPCFPSKIMHCLNRNPLVLTACPKRPPRISSGLLQTLPSPETHTWHLRRPAASTSFQKLLQAPKTGQGLSKWLWESPRKRKRRGMSSWKVPQSDKETQASGYLGEAPQASIRANYRSCPVRMREKNHRMVNARASVKWVNEPSWPDEMSFNHLGTDRW